MLPYNTVSREIICLLRIHVDMCLLDAIPDTQLPAGDVYVYTFHSPTRYMFHMSRLCHAPSCGTPGWVTAQKPQEALHTCLMVLGSANRCKALQQASREARPPEKDQWACNYARCSDQHTVHLSLSLAPHRNAKVDNPLQTPWQFEHSNLHAEGLERGWQPISCHTHTHTHTPIPCA